MQYHQITSGERYAIAALRRQGLSVARHRPRPRQGALDDLPRGGEEPPQPRRRLPRLHRLRAHAARGAGARAATATSASRSGRSSSSSSRLDWSPEQVAGWLRRHELLAISYETIYLHVWRDKGAGGELWRHMRQAGKKRRKRYGAHDSRGRLAGKRHISERPAEVEGSARRRPLGDRHGHGRRPGAAHAC